MKPPRPLPPVPRVIPLEPYVAPVQTTILEHLAALPPQVTSPPEVPAALAAPAWAAPTVVEVDVRPTGLQALRASIPDPDGMPESEIPASPGTRTRTWVHRVAPRMAYLSEIALIAKYVFGLSWWTGAAVVLGVSERQVRRWRSGESSPSMEHVRLMRDEGEDHLALLDSALSIGLAVPLVGPEPHYGSEPEYEFEPEDEAEASSSEAADAPHVRAGEAVPEAGALPVELGQPGRVEPLQAARERPGVDDG
ncbi:hypothetical protein ASF57_18810 [Methylobacterium sp. Leaf117]|nr:hypothetical protein ASF57_18810 [Methylobacterium sp. Leaf117]